MESEKAYSETMQENTEKTKWAENDQKGGNHRNEEIRKKRGIVEIKAEGY